VIVTPHAEIAARMANRTGLALLARQVAAAGATNAMVAPTCLVTALTMAAAGSAGRTQEELGKALQVAPGQPAPIDAANASLGLLAKAMTGNKDAAEYSMANGLFVARDAKLRRAFAAGLKTNLEARVEAVDFASRSTLARLNVWYAQATRGMIPSMLDHVAADTRMLLASAVAFVAPWLNPFSQTKTTTRPFHTVGGRTRSVPMMEQTDDEFLYLDAQGFQAIRLPYAGKHYELIVALSSGSAGIDLAQWIGRATDREWGPLLGRGGYASRAGVLVIPKLELALGGEVRQLLEQDGDFGVLLRPGADLGGVAHEPLAIGQIIHRTFIRMDEKGTEAAGATGMNFARTSAKPPPFRMIVDRPYLFAIRHIETGAVAFAGYVADPSATSA